MAGHDSGTTLPGPSHRLALFGDTVGLPQLLDAVGKRDVVALVGAAIRPDQHDALAALAARYDSRFLVQPRPTEPGYGGFLHAIADLAPDLFIVNSYAMILRPDLLAVPRHGAVNVHGALLPAYRGANPTEWALINGERETGVTIHLIDAGIDTGPIVAQRAVPIRFEDTWVDVRRRVGAATEALLQDVMPRMLAGSVTVQPQDEGRARYWKRRKASDGAFSWDLPVITIYNLVRALVAPHPGAHADGITLDTWQSLPEIVWRKFRAGHGAWSGARWRMVPSRPHSARSRRMANSTVAFDVRSNAGGPVGRVRLSGVSEPPGPVRAVIEYAPRARISARADGDLRMLVARFAAEELKRDVKFASAHA